MSFTYKRLKSILSDPDTAKRKAPLSRKSTLKLTNDSAAPMVESDDGIRSSKYIAFVGIESLLGASLFPNLAHPIHAPPCGALRVLFLTGRYLIYQTREAGGRVVGGDEDVYAYIVFLVLREVSSYAARSLLLGL